MDPNELDGAAGTPERVEFVIWRMRTYGPPDKESPFNSGGKHVIQVVPSDMMIPAGWSEKWGRLNFSHDGPIEFDFGRPHQEHEWKVEQARFAGATIYHLLPHRQVDDPAQERERLKWIERHADLESAEEEARRLCGLGWSAHIWEDSDPREFVVSWEPGPDGPRQDPMVYVEWGDATYPIITRWMVQ